MNQRGLSVKIGLDGKAQIKNDFSEIGQAGDAAFGNLGKAIRQATGAISDMEKRAAILRAQIDPSSAAQIKMNAAIAEAGALLKTGTITQAEHTAAVSLARNAVKDAAAATSSFAAAAGFGSAQSLAFTAALRHMFDAIVAGRPPLQAVASETGNLSFALSGGGGLMAAVKATGSAILGFLVSPLGLALEGIALLAAPPLIGYFRASAAAEELGGAIKGAGRAAGVTANQLETISETAADSAGITSGAARDIAAAFVKTGSVGREQIEGLIDLTSNFARAFDLSSGEAAKALSSAFSDPSGSGEKLLVSLGALDGKTKRYIDTLIAEGRETEAQEVLQRKLTEATDEAAHSTSLLAEAWNAVKGAASGAADAFAKIVFPTLDQQIERARAQVEALPRKTIFGSENPLLEGAQRNLSDLLGKKAIEQAKANTAARETAANKLSLAGAAAVEAAVPGLAQQNTLEGRVNLLDKILASEDLIKKSGFTREGVFEADQFAKAALFEAKAKKDATEAIKQHKDALSSDLRAAQSAVASGKQDLARLEAETEARKRLNDAVASGTLTSDQATQAFRDEVELAKLRADKAAALAKGYGAEADALQRIIDRLPHAAANDDAEQSRSRALREIEGQERANKLLKEEIALQGRGSTEAERELAVFEAKQHVLELNIPLVGKEGRQILENARKAEVLKQQLDLARASRGEIEGLFDSVSGQFTNFIEQGKFGWKDFANAAAGALHDIENELIKLSITNPLKKLLFGDDKLPDLGSVGGLFGSIFGSVGSGGSSGGFLDAGTAIFDSFGIGHTGMTAGFANTNRELPVSVLRFAPRLHSGGFLGPDEVPAILQRGERVLNRQETRDFNTGKSRKQGGEALVINYAPSYDARGADAQAVARLERAMAKDRVEFRGNVIKTLQEARTRRMIA